MLILNIIAATLYPVCYKLSDNYADKTFNGWVMILTEVLFAALMSLLIFLLVLKREVKTGLFLICAIVNLGISYYLYIWNGLTFGIFPVYNVVVTFTLIFDCIFGRDNFN